MVPGQVLTQETIDFMRKLDVKEIHGYEKARGLKLVKPDAVAGRVKGSRQKLLKHDAIGQGTLIRGTDMLTFSSGSPPIHSSCCF